MVLNVLRGVPSVAEELVTPRALAAAVGNKQWMGETRENGEGVTFAEMRAYLEQSLRVYGLEDYEIEVFRPAAASSHDLEKLRQLLAQNEESNRDLVLLYFNQGVLTGDWDGPPYLAHWRLQFRKRTGLGHGRGPRYVPYWSPISKVLDSMLRPTPENFGHLRGETGGIFHIKPKQP
jgi:hypothetical protein